MSANVATAGDNDFEKVVLETSHQLPVLVDFWAPWCGPCRTLGPLLERIADEQPGKFLLVKVNVDENPGLSQAFRVQSIPMVVAFRGGAPVGQFVGALPQTEIDKFLEQIMPSQAEQLAAQALGLLSKNQPDRAEPLFRQALDLDARCDQARLGLAQLLIVRGEPADALAQLERIAPGPLRSAADRLAAQIRVAGSAAADVDQLQQTVDSRPADLEARFAYAQALAARRRYEEALTEYLEIVRRNRSYQDGAARKAMLDIFDLLGSGEPLVERYRAELAKVLFS